MVSLKPVFLVFAGAWHLSETLNPFLSEVHKLGYDTSSATLATVNNASAGLLDDIALMQSKLEDRFAAERDVILAVHSYAGNPGSVVVKGHSKAERKALHLPGGIIGAIYFPAMVLVAGRSGLEMLGGKYLPWQHANYATGLLEVTDPRSLFYQDVPEPLATEIIAKIQPWSIKGTTQEVPPVGITDTAFDGRRAFIRTLRDNASLPPLQQAALSRSSVAWIERCIDTGHSPFLAKPTELAGIFDELAGIFHTPEQVVITACEPELDG